MSPVASGLMSPPGQQLLLQLSPEPSLVSKASALPVRLVFGLGLAQLLLGLLLLLLGLLVLLEGGWLTQLVGALGCGSALLLSGALSVAMARRAHHSRPLLVGFLAAVLVSFAGSCLLVVLSSARLVTDSSGGVSASVYEVVDKVSSPPLELLGRSAAGLLDAALLVLSVFALLLMLLTLAACAGGLCRGRRSGAPTPLGYRLALSDSAALLLGQVAWISTPAVLQPAEPASSVSRLQQVFCSEQPTPVTSRDRRGSANHERRMTSLEQYSAAADAWRDPSDRPDSPVHGQHGVTSERRHSYVNQEFGMTSDGQHGRTEERRRAMSLGRRHRSTNQQRGNHRRAVSKVLIGHGGHGNDYTQSRSRSQSRSGNQSRSRSQSRARSQSRSRSQSRNRSRSQSQNRDQCRGQSHVQKQSQRQTLDQDESLSLSRSRRQDLGDIHQKLYRDSSRGHTIPDPTCELSGRSGRHRAYVSRDLDLSLFEHDLSELERELSDLDRDMEEQVLVVNIQRSLDTASLSDSLRSRM